MFKFKLSVTMAIVLALFFVGCDTLTPVEETETTETTETTDPAGITINYIANDGFGLKSSNIAFDNSASVSNLDDGTTVDDSIFYAPTDLSELEDGDDPVIYFTFTEDLKSSLVSAIFHTAAGSDTSNGDMNQGIFFGGEGSITTKSISVSGPTVSFTFEAGTFSLDKEVDVYFGVVSANGEYYTVTTCFQPQADITESVSLTADFSAYHAYAIDSNRMYFLGLEDDGDHTTAGTDAEKILSATYNAGTDFGTAINSLSKRATSTTVSNPTQGTYAHLLELYTEGNYKNYIPFILSRVEYAEGYAFYYEDNEGNRSNEALDIDVINYEYEDEDADELVIISYSINVNIYDDYSISTGDKIVCVPYNARGSFTNCEGSYTLTDNIHPFRKDGITMTETSSFTWTGVDYTGHTEALAHEEGHLVSFGTWDVTELDGYDDGEVHEGLIYTLNSSSLTAKSSVATSGGSQKEWLEADVREFLDLDEDITLFSSNNGYLWTYMIGEKIYVYGGFNCNVNDSAVSYLGETWTAKGPLSVTVEDASGNTLYFNDSTSDQSDGVLNISIIQ